MSVANVHVFMYYCDLCGAKERLESVIFHDDLPDGWTWFYHHGESELLHACAQCARQVDDNHMFQQF